MSKRNNGRSSWREINAQQRHAERFALREEKNRPKHEAKARERHQRERERETLQERKQKTMSTPIDRERAKLVLDHMTRGGKLRVQFGRGGPSKDFSFEEIDRSVRGAFGGSLLPSDNQQVRALTTELEKHKQMLAEIMEQPKDVGVIIDTFGDKECMIVVGGQKSVVRLPQKAGPGDTVVLNKKTGQAVGRIETETPHGACLVVQAIVKNGGGYEVTAPEGTKIVLAGQTKAEVGERIILDESGSVAIAAMGRALTQQTFGENPNVAWDDVGGQEEAKEVLREAIEAPVLHAEIFARYGKKPPAGVLLYGPPGNGKTLLAKACATAMHRVHGANVEGGFISVKGPELLSKWFGETEANIRGIFAQARGFKKKTGFPAVVFIDEADAVLSDRSKEGLVGRTAVPAFLTEMQGLKESDAFVILATNRPGDLDPAVIRDKRIDRRVCVTRPGKNTAESIFRLYLQGRPIWDQQTAEQLAKDAVALLFAETLVIQSLTMAVVLNGEISTQREVQLLLGDLVSGALIEGLVDLATEYAIKREREGGVPGIMPTDIDRACGVKAREMGTHHYHEDMIAKAKAMLPELTQPGAKVQVMN